VETSRLLEEYLNRPMNRKNGHNALVTTKNVQNTPDIERKNNAPNKQTNIRPIYL